MGTCSPVSAASQTYLSFPPPGLKNLILSGLTVMAQVYHDKDGTKHHNMEGSSRDGSPVEKLEHAEPGYGHERDERAMQDLEDENPNVYHHMCFKLFTGLTAMAFLWVGSQIPLYLFGALLPDIYTDIGGAERYQWIVIGYLIPNASLCPFVGALSDMFGRRWVAAAGQVLLIVGPIVTATANTMNTAIGGQVISGLGAGLNELIALAGTAELVPTRKRGSYVGAVVFYHKFVTAATRIVGGSLAEHVTTDLQTLTELVTLAGEARFDEARHILTTSSKIIEPYNGQYGMDLLINKTQEAFALAYRWPYWMSIAFGGICIVCSLFLKDVRHFVEAG